MSDQSQGAGWWVASDGKWYPPHLHPDYVPPVPPPAPVGPPLGAAPPVAPAAAPPPAAKNKRGCLWWIGLAVVAMILIGVIGALAGSGGDDSSDAGTDPFTTAPDDDDDDTGTTVERTTTTEPPGFGGGVKLVGSEIQPGRYVSNNDGGGCYYARLRDTSGEFDAIITNGNPDGRAVVDIAQSDGAFDSQRCARWVPWSPPSVAPLTSFSDGDWAVGFEIEPGTYRSDSGSGCYWERAKGFGHDFGEIITNANPEGTPTVTIASSDVRFTSQRCGTWTKIG